MLRERRYRLPYGPGAPVAAREALSALAGTITDGILGELQLLASELVTNAVRHGRPDGAGGVHMDIALSADKARVTVVDGGNGFVPPAAPVDPRQPGGWGLVVVAGLADRWGMERGPGTRVWAEIEVAPGAARRDGATMAAPACSV